MEIEPSLEQFLINFARQKLFNWPADWPASAPDTRKHIKKIAEHYDFWGWCNYNAYKETISEMCEGPHPKKLLIWCGTLESLPTRNYLIEDSKN
jgi:hypothetical protein